MTAQLPWDLYGEPPTERELPYRPPASDRILIPPTSALEPHVPPAPVAAPPVAPAPAPPPIDVTGITDAIRDALGMGGQPPPPPPPPPVDTAKDIVKADARSRSKRTLIQGLLFDLFAAVVASVALLAGADPFVKETWIGFGILLVKSVVSAGISYVMRMRSTPTMRTKGEKYAVAPLPRPMPDNERQTP